MSSDIVERLVEATRCDWPALLHHFPEVIADAAAEITKLRADLATAMRKLSIAEEEVEAYHKFWIEERDKTIKLSAELSQRDSSDLAPGSSEPVAVLEELNDCRDAIASIKRNRTFSDTQNRNLAFYQGRVDGIQFVIKHRAALLKGGG